MAENIIYKVKIEEVEYKLRDADAHALAAENADAIATLQDNFTAIQEITSAEISALFAK